MSPVKIVALVLIISLMLQTGFSVNRASLKAMLTDYGLLGRALLANFILVPLFALLLVRAFHLDDFVAIAILLMAIAPGVPFLPLAGGRSRGGSLGFAITLALLMPALSVITAPITAGLVLPSGAAAHFPVGSTIVSLVIFQLVPLLAGMVIADRSPSFAAKLQRPLLVIFGVCVAVLLALLAPMIVKSVASVYGSYAIITALLVVLFSAATGWLLAGAEPHDRNTLTIATTLRNVGLASLVATQSFPGTAAEPTVVVYLIVQVVVATLVGRYFGRSLKMQATTAS